MSLTAEPSSIDVLMEDVLQRTRALLETNNIPVDNSSAVAADDESTSNEDELSDTEDAHYREEDLGLQVPRWNTPFTANYCGLRIPLGFYDPFNVTFPCNGYEAEWGRDALYFVMSSFQASACRPWMDLMFNSMFRSEIDSQFDLGDRDRTWYWFEALPLDLKVEVYIQRNLGLRPRSLWILAPHDDESSIWARRYESGRCIIPKIRFSGMYCAYEICRGQGDAPNNRMPCWWSDPVARPLTITNSNLDQGFDFDDFTNILDIDDILEYID